MMIKILGIKICMIQLEQNLKSEKQHDSKKKKNKNAPKNKNQKVEKKGKNRNEIKHAVEKISS